MAYEEVKTDSTEIPENTAAPASKYLQSQYSQRRSLLLSQNSTLDFECEWRPIDSIGKQNLYYRLVLLTCKERKSRPCYAIDIQLWRHFEGTTLDGARTNRKLITT